MAAVAAQDLMSPAELSQNPRFCHVNTSQPEEKRAKMLRELHKPRRAFPSAVPFVHHSLLGNPQRLQSCLYRLTLQGASSHSTGRGGWHIWAKGTGHRSFRVLVSGFGACGFWQRLVDVSLVRELLDLGVVAM